jgi:hypothetical protein
MNATIMQYDTFQVPVAGLVALTLSTVLTVSAEVLLFGKILRQNHGI